MRSLPPDVGGAPVAWALLQSNSKQPAYLYQRYQDFYPKTEKSLRDMSEADLRVQTGAHQ